MNFILKRTSDWAQLLIISWMIILSLKGLLFGKGLLTSFSIAQYNEFELSKHLTLVWHPIILNKKLAFKFISLYFFFCILFYSQIAFFPRPYIGPLFSNL